MVLQASSLSGHHYKVTMSMHCNKSVPIMHDMTLDVAKMANSKKLNQPPSDNVPQHATNKRESECLGGVMVSGSPRSWHVYACTGGTPAVKPVCRP